MRYSIVLFIGFMLLPFFLAAQNFVTYSTQADRLIISLTDGKLHLIPLTTGAVRVQFLKELPAEANDFVVINKPAVPFFRVTEDSVHLKLVTSKLQVFFNKQTGVLEFADVAGKLFLREKPGSRSLTPNSIDGQACYVAAQGFHSPEDEYLFGLGQFQDGHFNLKDVSRKLIQVNSQIAIPFLFSSKGYGLLWHQYGLTAFNPADKMVTLIKSDSTAGDKGEVEVTTTSGTQRVSRQQSLYKGKFFIDKAGTYSLMLDLGEMESRHLLIIDGIPVIDQANIWLPPAASKVVPLTAGEHTVQVVCKASNTPELTIRPTDNTTNFRSPHAKALDYIVFYGPQADSIIAGYRMLTGKVPMLPLWAYGFWQCRERYTSGTHLVETIKEFRKRNLPVDVIVQDWQYWGRHGWGVPQFDTVNYPNPKQFIDTLHNLNARFSISVWENLDKKSNVAKAYLDKNLYIPNSPWIDIYNPETQQTHWSALNENLFKLGVDSWWMDATEPENDALKGKQTYFGPGEFYRLTYPFFVSKAVYNGQRNTDPTKRVTILTRSAFPGQQRFGTINWSGDIGWNWDAFKRQIVAGLNYNLTGMPYWTTDIGGFFRPGRGQYTDTAYHEILTRWFQYGTFNPIFRMHGYQTETEPWKYGSTVEHNMRKMLNLRYRLMPYIYSEAWQVTHQASTLMRPLIMDFAHDSIAISQPYQFMFGKQILVAPVTASSRLTWPVYLPKTTQWFDYFTTAWYDGGQVIQAAAPIDRIPLFVRAGAIIPEGKILQYTAQQPYDTLTIKIYCGANGSFTYYEDEGDNYNYESGQYNAIPFNWNEQKSMLTIGRRNGSFKGQLGVRVFHLYFYERGPDGHAIYKEKFVTYKGNILQIKR